MANQDSENSVLTREQVLALDIATHTGYFSLHEAGTWNFTESKRRLANALVLEISPDDGEYQSYSNKDMIKPALEAGYSYTYTITVKKTGLTLSGSTIENWNDGGSHAGDAKM